ncbi:MAG: glycosyltransferase, partial [Sphingobacteriales bacterium]
MDERIPCTPPRILPVEKKVPRPRWSVMIPAYNCIGYLKQTIESVLSQGIPEEQMQIEVVDDFSTDGDVEALVLETGKGRVKFYRQEKNRGSLRNFETCINRAKGHWVHLLHGDDLVRPGFYKEIEMLFKKHPEAGAAFTDFIYMNEQGEELYAEKKILDVPGIPENWLATIARGQRIQPPAIVVKREVYEDLGGFFAVHYGEDWEMWTRIASKYKMAHSPKYLAKYRIHTNNITSRSFMTGQNVRDIGKVIGLIQNYLPQQERDVLRRDACRNFSEYFAKISDKIYHEYRNPAAALCQVKEALHLDVNKTTLFF